MPQHRPRSPRPRRLALAIAIGATLGAPGTPAWAVGFGASQIGSTLGQALDFSVQMAGDGDEAALSCVSAEVYAGDARVDPQAVSTHLEQAAARSGASTGGLLRVRTAVAVDEPVVTVVIDAGCTARLTRRFVVFVDPPKEHLAAAAPTAEPAPAGPTDAAPPVPTALPVVDSEGAIGRAAVSAPVPAPAPVPTGTAQALQPTPPPRHRRRTAPAETVASSGEPAPAQPAATRRSAAPMPERLMRAVEPRPATTTAGGSATPPVTLSRLKLDAEPDFGASPAARASSASSEPSVVAMVDLARYAALEAKIAKLEADSAAASANVDVLRRQLRAASSPATTTARAAEELGHPGWPWQALSAVLAAAVALLAWQRLRPPPRADWRNSDSAAADDADAAIDIVSPVAAPVAPLGGDAAMTPAQPVAPAPAVPVAPPPPTGPLVAAEPRRTAPAATPSLALPAPSVEDLLDLEQQFEFFTALGQDASAIELMQSRLATGPGAHPMPYLTLMDAYRRLGDEAAYREVHAGFERQFNAAAPGWNEPPSTGGRAIEDYPDQLAALIGAWPTPSDAAARLGTWIVRDDAAANDARFDMPAFRDMMFLHTLAREMSVRDGRTAVLQPLAFEPAQDTPPPAEHTAVPTLDWSMSGFRFDAEATAANVDIELELPSVDPQNQAADPSFGHGELAARR